MSAAPLWQPLPSQIEKTHMFKFQKEFEKTIQTHFENYEELHQASVNHKEEFWSLMWNYAELIGTKGDTPYFIDDADIKKSRFFPDAKLNFAENILEKNSQDKALIFYGEDKVQYNYSSKQLYQEVSQIQQYLIAKGIQQGDRVGAILPNKPETIVAMLACASIGAIWSSCSPDFGVEGVLDRFGQIQPKLLFVCDQYFYNGKSHSCLEKNQAIFAELSDCDEMICIPYLPEANIHESKIVKNYQQILQDYSAKQIDYAQLPFDHPLYIMYSSGTTGKPKSIVHRAGGTLIQHVKEHLLHCDIQPNDRVFYFTTCGWMMWNWLVTALASDASLILYDGSPFYPSGERLFEIAEKERMTFLGTSAKYIDALSKNHIHPNEKFDLSDLRVVASTGSPLVAENFDYVYDKIKSDLHLTSISGGTDIISCFVLGNPTQPVYRGQIQSPGLGMDVRVADEESNFIVEEKGELTCCTAFPSMPLGFWKDTNDQKYHEAYFDQFDNIWCHGDFIEETAEGGYIIYGRSDAVLNPGGVRIGTAEIYRQVEQLEEIVESIAVGQNWQNDVRIILFVKLRNELHLDPNLIQKIKQAIRQNTTPRHVPALILQVSDIPRTKSGKITELAIKKIIHGQEVKNVNALANPECLEEYKQLLSELAA